MVERLLSSSAIKDDFQHFATVPSDLDEYYEIRIDFYVASNLSKVVDFEMEQNFRWLRDSPKQYIRLALDHVILVSILRTSLKGLNLGVSQETYIQYELFLCSGCI